MLIVELEAKDFAKGVAFVRIGRIAAAIARANGSENPDLAARTFSPIVNAGVKRKLLNPVDAETLRPLPTDNWGNGIVPVEELIEWGAQNRFAFREKPPISAAMTDESRIKWCKKLLWQLHEGVSILVGLEPIIGDKNHPNDVADGIADKPIRARWEELYNDAKDAMELSPPLLPWKEPRIGGRFLNRRVIPAAFTAFAQSRGVELSPPLIAIARSHAILNGEPLQKHSERQENAPDAHTVVKPLSRHLYQEQEILRTIGELGYTAKALPKVPTGQRGVKAAVRERLTMTTTVFDKAWERLRKQHDIDDAS